MLGANPRTTPIDYSHKSSKNSDRKEVSNPTSYRQLVGKLLYLTFIRPDIFYVVQVPSQFMEKPKHDNLLVTYTVLKYLKKAHGQGILMKLDSNFIISTYLDSDWAGCIDTRKSVTRYCIFLGNSLIN